MAICKSTHTHTHTLCFLWKIHKTFHHFIHIDFSHLAILSTYYLLWPLGKINSTFLPRFCFDIRGKYNRLSPFYWFFRWPILAITLKNNSLLAELIKWWTYVVCCPFPNRKGWKKYNGLVTTLNSVCIFPFHYYAMGFFFFISY